MMVASPVAMVQPATIEMGRILARTVGCFLGLKTDRTKAITGFEECFSLGYGAVCGSC
jgi:hypothetical protein